MGDTGSLALGGLIAAIAMVLKQEILLVIIGFVFVAEVLSVIIQVTYYKKTHKRIFKMAPLHHHFEKCGWSETKVVTRFWLVGVVLAVIGLILGSCNMETVLVIGAARSGIAVSKLLQKNGYHVILTDSNEVKEKWI